MSKMKRILALVFALGFVSACVTVNIYFPAAKVQKAAEEIVDEVYGTKAGAAPAPAPAQPAAEAPKPSSSLAKRAVIAMAGLISPKSAWAEDATTVSNANIRALKDQIAANHAKLAPHYDAGRVGIGKDGLLVFRGAEGLGLKEVADLKRLIDGDNQARTKLYQEVAGALGIDPGQTGKVNEVFAKEWQGKAPAGWWIQDPGGSWRKK